ncbi:ATP-grasp domain protein [Bordetella bronchiseptica GA96-01]|uniref:acetate--CoA ligase family protein n=1 Tax=Bordetella bronchiseptica TaxID=518 RepID=UPI00045AB3D6|nr:acetate--CoA ligase family protein [Bordetella bronchiseptica]AZW29672.1 CoA-binding protein [Bordetella bronchiseptica]KCV45898.1 ATP-grasp domain protein [Bordetella bronchiseptica 345]KDC41695.1 ATP-grasp domain protein [Bordetella bronchiseptica GA96-01]
MLASNCGFPDLSRLVRPRNVAVVLGSQRPNSEGARLLENLSAHSRMDGELFVVNPPMRGDGPFRCWPSIADLPEAEIDVALIILRAAYVMDALRDCAARGIPFAIVMSSGFGEAGPEGRALEQQVAALCAATGLRAYGPNCPGLSNFRDRMGMTISPAFKTDRNVGSIGIVTQGGGAGRNIVQGLSHGPGPAMWLSAGNEVDLGAPDFIAHLANDPEIGVIAVLLEGIKDGQRLIAALDLARARGKPVVMLKIGRSEYGVRAAQSHTGSIAGTAAINSAMFAQFGVIEAHDMDELVALARLAAQGRLPASDELAVVTFSGGAAAMAADQIGLQGLRLARFSPATTEHLRASLPGYAAIANPVDVTAEALNSIDGLASCLRTVAQDPGVGAVIVPIPADYADLTDGIAQAVIDAAAGSSRPIVAVWMSRRLGSGFRRLEEHGLAPFLSLTSALAAVRKLTPRHLLRASAAPREPEAGVAPAGPDTPGACTEAAAKAMLRVAGIPVPQGSLCRTPEETAAAAQSLGFPVALKIASAQILHKTEVGGVRLDVRTAGQAAEVHARMVEQVRAQRPDACIDGVLVEKMLHDGGREMLVAVRADPMYGRVLTIGLGGIFVELLKDVAHRILPVRPDDIHDMLADLRHRAYLGQFRNLAPMDCDAFVRLAAQLAEFVARRPDIVEAEFNPVWVGPAGAGAWVLDALLLTSPSSEHN